MPPPIIVHEGRSLTPWLHRPDGGVIERLEWETDVIPSFGGQEQRVMLRGLPRRSFEFDCTMTGRARRAAENLLHLWQGQPFALPVWMDSQQLGAPVSSGASSISIDTTTRDFHAGGLLGIASDAYSAEVVEIDSVSSGSITLAAPLAQSWPASADIFPMRAVELPDEVSLARFDGDTSYGALRWVCVDGSSWPAETPASTYRSLPVMQQAPNWTEDPSQSYMRLLDRLQPASGPSYTDDRAGGSIMLQSHRWLLDGRASISAFRSWLYARRGRLSSFWLPTFALDLAVVADIGSADTTIDVEHCGYTDTIAQDIGRRDIRIELASGATYLRRITGSAEISGTVERLTIDSALGAAVQAAQIRSVSYLDLVRLESDAVEIAWWRSDVAEVRASTRGSRDDL